MNKAITIIPTSVRLPEDVLRVIDESAAENLRSRTAEILYRLKQSIRPAPESTPESEAA